MGKTHHLAALLRAYLPSAAERGFHDDMLALLERGEGAFARDHYQPGHFTASAFVLDAERASLLLILHAKLGRWLQPGGHIEPDDADAIAAARRELREEVGLGELNLLQDRIFDIDIHDIPAHKTMPPHRHYDVRFVFVAAPHAELRASSDALEARWVALDAVSQIESDASVMRAVERLRAIAS